MRKNYDAVVLGAGQAGVAAAMELRQSGWDVAVVEKSRLPRDKVCGGFIGPENKALFERWGILEELRRRGAVPVQNICLRSSLGAGVDVPITCHGVSDTGLAVSRKILDGVMQERARQMGVAVYDATVVTRQEPFPGGGQFLRARCRGESKDMELVARHVIDATGAAGKNISGHSQRLFGVAANFKDVPSMSGNVYLYFFNQAHLGINRFEDGEVNVCYVVSEKLFRSMDGRMEDIFRFMKKTHPMLEEHMGPARQVTPWSGTFISRPSHFKFYHEDRFCVGDAAGLINPVMGGGITLAVNSAVLLTMLLKRHTPQELPVEKVAAEYERLWRAHFSRRVQSSWMFGAAAHHRWITEATVRLFRSSNRLLHNAFDHAHRTEKLRAALAERGGLS